MIVNVYGPPRGWEGGQNYPPTPSPTPGTKNPGMGVPGRLRGTAVVGVSALNCLAAGG